MKRTTLKFVSFLFICTGVFLAVSAVLPIVKYELLAQREVVASGDFISPLSDESTTSPSDNKDLTRASNWFVGDPHLPDVTYQVPYYKLSIPRLKVKDAVVQIAGDDLSRNLVQFHGTAIPGRLGNAVVFGHSTLPQIYNPKNYLTIFTYLPSLAKGDLVIVDYDGITYTFKVSEMIEVKPEDIQILEQRYDNSYLSLVTCVPPGTSIRRLVVRAKLVLPDAGV